MKPNLKKLIVGATILGILGYGGIKITRESLYIHPEKCEAW